MKNEKYIDIALPWIINYFSKAKSATIDLNRYRIEHFMMTTSIKQVDDAIINSLRSEDCYIREHMSDIIGEKRLISAIELLKTQLLIEKNYFTAQSMIEAIGKLDVGGLEIIERWVNLNKDEIIRTQQLYVLRHSFNAITRLDHTSNSFHINKFKEEFGEILENYFII